jgi:hypothetical protein
MDIELVDLANNFIGDVSNSQQDLSFGEILQK